MKEITVNVHIDGKVLQLKNLSKIIDATSETTRAQIINYYTNIKNYILPNLIYRPFSQIVFPEGVGGSSFYRKAAPVNPPEFLSTAILPSTTKGTIEWVLVNDLPSIVYMVSLGCIEMHTWFSDASTPLKPSYAAIDLDLSGNSTFANAITIAKALRVLLDKLKIYSVPKTSGKRGIHILIPIKDTTFKEVQIFLYKLSSIVVNAYPDIATLNRAVKDRGDRIYLDTLQNAYGKTIAAPYSLRATPNLTLSMPIKWYSINETLNPKDYSIATISNIIKSNYTCPLTNFYQKSKSLTGIL